MKVKLIFIFILSAGIAPAQYPTANFSVSSYTVCVNGCISCMDLSVAGTDPITAWDWTFQAGTPPVSTSQNPSNICYSTAGTYTITLIVTDLNGRSDTAQQIITVQTCSGINEFADNNAITIYPNPSGGIVMLQSAEKIQQLKYLMYWERKCIHLITCSVIYKLIFLLSQTAFTFCKSKPIGDWKTRKLLFSGEYLCS